MNFKPQVPKHIIFKNYDVKERWMSYWYQINLTLKTNSKKVLEVGIGNGTVSDYLKRAGLEVTTVDIDPKLNPDQICSVTELTNIFEPNSFDASLCYEVLEHIPFEYFEKALDELHTVSNKFVILSLPYWGPQLSIRLNASLIGTKSFCIKLPLPTRHRSHSHAEGHCWEIGLRGFPLRKITKILEKGFSISEHFVCPENPYHLFFVLMKKPQ